MYNQDLKLVMQEYTLLDGTKKVMLKRVGDGKIIERFDRTPLPQKENQVVCPHFLELKWAYGCPYSCAWCYLQGTLKLLKTKKSPVVKSYELTERHLKSFFKYHEKEMLNAGEICDSLMAENYEKPFTKFIVPIFDERKMHELLLVTKSNHIENLLELKGKNTVVSFSINSEKVAKIWERAPPPKKRLEAARKLKEAGYRVRIRIDPILPVSGWVVSYRKIIDKVMKNSPERITLGSIRGLPRTINEARDKSWVRFLENGEKTNWGKRIFFEKRFRMFHELLHYLIDEYSFNDVGLCKETLGMWKELEKEFGIEYKIMKCNCTL